LSLYEIVRSCPLCANLRPTELFPVKVGTQAEYEPDWRPGSRVAVCAGRLLRVITTVVLIPDVKSDRVVVVARTCVAEVAVVAGAVDEELLGVVVVVLAAEVVLLDVPVVEFHGVVEVVGGLVVVVDPATTACFVRSGSATVIQMGSFSKTSTGDTVRVALDPNSPTVIVDLRMLGRPKWSVGSVYVTVKTSPALTLINPSSAAPASVLGTVSNAPAETKTTITSMIL
jgi:hypothetical protein